MIFLSAVFNRIKAYSLSLACNLFALIANSVRYASAKLSGILFPTPNQESSGILLELKNIDNQDVLLVRSPQQGALMLKLKTKPQEVVHTKELEIMMEDDIDEKSSPYYDIEAHLLDGAGLQALGRFFCSIEDEQSKEKLIYKIKLANTLP